MGVFIYNIAKFKLTLGNVNFNTDTFDVALCMTSTTAGDNTALGRDAPNVAAISLDEFDGANYARKTLTNILQMDLTNDRILWGSSDLAWTNLGAGNPGSRQIAGALILQNNGGGESGNIPMVWFDSAAVFPFWANGSGVTIQFGGNGIFFTRSV